MANPRIILRIVFTLLASFACLASVAFAQSSMTVRWSDERLSVQASGAAVASVLREVARQTHVQIRGLEKATGTADVEFAGKHLVDGLRVLLADFNYVIVLSSAESAPAILIHSRVEADNSAQVGPHNLIQRRTMPTRRTRASSSPRRTSGIRTRRSRSRRQTGSKTPASSRCSGSC